MKKLKTFKIKETTMVIFYVPIFNFPLYPVFSEEEQKNFEDALRLYLLERGSKS